MKSKELKLKFKKSYAGSYEAVGTYKGQEVSVFVEGYSEGGFYYSIHINDSYVDGDGWIGLRKKDILELIDRQVMWKVDEMIEQQNNY